MTDHLEALQLDVLSLLYWSKTVDGQANRNRPTPTPRPGMPTTDEPEDEGGSPFTSTVEEYLQMVAEAEAREGNE